MVDYMKLQNGSDIRGVAMKAAEGDTVELTEELAGTVGGAFGSRSARTLMISGYA